MKLAIAEDSAILRVGLSELLSGRGHEVTIAAGDGDQLLRELEHAGVDAVIMDVRMPPTFVSEGIECALKVRQRWPDTAVLVFSQYVETQYAAELLAGDPSGVGYLLKDRVAEVGQFLDALARVAAGETVLDPEVVSQLIGASATRQGIASLTARERDALELMAQGRSNAAIGQSLHISLGTVEKYVSAIFAKMGLEQAGEDHRRVLAVLRYLDVTA
ncbi:response regulator transcription factor [Rarobacter faecitabidus]|uniref:LuxR family two component transcriptional regulator n=1 Tax=Rarobacter faecitabidus TaxID=13243 RepID=A0A542ZWS9_RARFA|nr:response regulator transcription factor [Rarobacter faecitabidus]TQL64792.1 LuxR family two component transcriptional regulator [Rarobacter faecitabidus]